MRVMVDTNVLISALLFPKSLVAGVLTYIVSRHTLVLSSFVVDELRAVVARKFPQNVMTVERLLEEMRFELVYTPLQMARDLFDIRDEKDYPVLYTAMTNGIDVLVTGDKDFAGIDVDYPVILTPAQYIESYM
ncbi:MAG: putative toxin-antitoxin system toxin component, PIN family [Clostridia bacterium]|nr:putative toxin-antitoxin system toxin component, PIN family [Clostridia bacterium]